MNEKPEARRAHKAKPDPLAGREPTLCAECYAPIHAAWTYVGPNREPDLRWRHTGQRFAWPTPKGAARARRLLDEGEL